MKDPIDFCFFFKKCTLILLSFLGVVISVVDNYQGEENDIVLLSLVRSNEKASIGYLNIQSRICVALSRAKMGLFIVGNMSDLSKSSKTWSSIRNILYQNGQIGYQLVLQCQFHSESKLEVSSYFFLVLYHILGFYSSKRVKVQVLRSE